jgi:hypothetical protein
VQDTPRGLRIVVPAARDAGVIFLPVWLVGWVLGLKWTIGLLLTIPGPPIELALFVGAWLVAWISGGIWSIRSLAWMLAGREEIEIDQATLTIRRRILRLARTHTYDRNHVQHLRVFKEGTDAPSFLGLIRDANGTLAFDYGARTIRMGEGIDESEARHLLGRIQERFRLSTGSGTV